MRKGRLISALMAASMLMACGEQTPQQTQQRFVSTVAEAKQVAWPGGNPVDPAKLDSHMNRDNYMVVLDMSGSMSRDACSGEYRDKASAAKDVINRWLQSVDREANLGLIVFDRDGTSVRVPLGQDNRPAFRDQIENSRPEGSTPLKTAIKLAREQLTQRARYQQGYGTYRMLVITDGKHDQYEDPREEVHRIAANPANPIEIHTVGFCIDQSALNQPGVTVYRSARNPEELAAGLKSVLAESQAFATIQEFTGDDL